MEKVDITLVPTDGKMLDKIHNKLLMEFSPKQIVSYFHGYLQGLVKAGIIRMRGGKVYWINKK